MAIKRPFFAVYACQIRKRSKRRTILTQSPARAGGPAMRGAFGAVPHEWKDLFGFTSDNNRTWRQWLICGTE
ncbi:hypothetical protein [Roseovarius pacificus]|uniref:hypothetical protein n=1 Tax=Roseovarius pacificus TaxID=337701 RepID=UPI002A18D25A|nr:hypothetical protein [Roseovarius pacificus]